MLQSELEGSQTSTLHLHYDVVPFTPSLFRLFQNNTPLPIWTGEGCKCKGLL